MAAVYPYSEEGEIKGADKANNRGQSAVGQLGLSLVPGKVGNALRLGIATTSPHRGLQDAILDIAPCRSQEYLSVHHEPLSSPNKPCFFHDLRRPFAPFNDLSTLAGLGQSGRLRPGYLYNPSRFHQTPKDFLHTHEPARRASRPTLRQDAATGHTIDPGPTMESNRGRHYIQAKP